MGSEDRGNAETEQMFALVGRAITAWSFIELSLCHIFIVCVTPCPVRPGEGGPFDTGHVRFIDSAVPTAIFYSVESFRAKLGLVDAALRERVKENGEWAQELRTNWERLRDKTRKLSLKRNKLAHWTVTPAFSVDEDFHQARLMPPYGSPGWYSETGANPPGLAITPSQIVHLIRAFQLIDDKLRCFYREFAQHPRLSDKYDQLTVRLIHSHDRLDPTRGERIRRDLASRE